jgi:hypothetical protein
MSNVVLHDSLSTSKITITAPKVLESGAKASYLNYEGGKLVLQTALSMSLPFGLSVYDKNPSGTPEYSVDLSFRGADTNPEIKAFQAKMTELDNFMIDQGVKNCKAWFKSDLKREVVQAFYTPIVKFAKDKEGNLQPYPPTLKAKLRKIKDDFEAKFYDVGGKAYKDTPIEDLLPKNAQVTCLLECGGVWFAGSKYGLTFRVKQVVIHKLPERLGDFAFRIPAHVVEAETSAAAPAASASAGAGRAPSRTVSAPAPALVDEDEDDNAVDDEEEAQLTRAPSVLAAVMPAPAPAPVEPEEAPEDEEAPPVPKKAVVKKKVPAVVKKA